LFLQTNNNPSFPSLDHNPNVLAGAPSSFCEGGLLRSNATTSRSSLECGSPAAAFTVSTKSQIASPTETCHCERSRRSEDLCLFPRLPRKESLFLQADPRLLAGAPSSFFEGGLLRHNATT